MAKRAKRVEPKIEVIGIGSLNYDYTYQVDALAHGDQQVVINNTFGSPGGSAANSIFVLGRLGVKTGFFGAVGTDPEGEEIIEQMVQVGIDITSVKRVSDQATGQVLVFVDRSGERAMYSLPGANVKLTINDIDIDYLRNSKYLIISAIPGKQALNMLIRTIEQLSSSQSPQIIFMPGALYSSLGLKVIKPIIEKTYILVLNRREFKLLVNSNSSSVVDMQKLTKIGCTNVVITAGKDGCVLKSNGSFIKIPTPELSPNLIIDSTGAGDAFTAGLIYGLVIGKSFQVSCFMGNLLARNCLQALGARSGSINKVKLENEFKRFSKEILYEQ